MKSKGVSKGFFKICVPIMLRIIGRMLSTQSMTKSTSAFQLNNEIESVNENLRNVCIYYRMVVLCSWVFMPSIELCRKKP